MTKLSVDADTLAQRIHVSIYGGKNRVNGEFPFTPKIALKALDLVRRSILLDITIDKELPKSKTPWKRKRA